MSFLPRLIFCLLFLLATTTSATEGGACAVTTSPIQSCGTAPAPAAASTGSPIASQEVASHSSLRSESEMAIPANAPTITLKMFYAFDCPHCHEAMKWLPELTSKFPNLKVETFEIKKDPTNRVLFATTAKENNVQPSGVPTFFIGHKTFVGFFKGQTCAAIIDEVKAITFGTHGESCPDNEIRVPILGTLKVNQLSLMHFSLALGLLDGLNPCAMWVLMFLLGLLAHTKSSKRVFLIGSIFILSSGAVYFAFMSAWLNLFSIIGYSKIITLLLAVVAIAMGLINLKELFFFKSGISLMIPESAKPKIASRVRGIMQSQVTLLSVFATIVLAIFVNFIELGCTIGLPAIFTKILAGRNVTLMDKYFYLFIYNLAYIVPLAIIMSVFGITLGHFKMTQRHGKILKCISGLLMLVMGLIMLIRPELLTLT